MRLSDICPPRGLMYEEYVAGYRLVVNLPYTIDGRSLCGGTACSVVVLSCVGVAPNGGGGHSVGPAPRSGRRGPVVRMLTASGQPPGQHEHSVRTGAGSGAQGSRGPLGLGGAGSQGRWDRTGSMSGRAPVRTATAAGPAAPGNR